MKTKADYLMARKVIALQDEHGFPVDISLQMCAETNQNISLLGLILEMGKRKWGLAKIREVAQCYVGHFDSTELELQALSHLGVNHETVFSSES